MSKMNTLYDDMVKMANLPKYPNVKHQKKPKTYKLKRNKTKDGPTIMLENVCGTINSSEP